MIFYNNDEQHKGAAYYQMIGRALRDNITDTQRKLAVATAKARYWLDHEGGRRYDKDGRFTTIQSFDIPADSRYVRIVASVNSNVPIDLALKAVNHGVQKLYSAYGRPNWHG